MTEGRRATSARRPRVRRVALTGSPGVGKSAIAELLRPRFRVREVAEVALGWGVGRRRAGGVEVDLAALSRRLRRDPPDAPEVLVGHLAHLLPVPDAVVLRCHPVELARRLTRARRGTARDRRANVEAEATDLVLLEARSLGRRVWEIDTTHRTPNAVARDVARILRVRPPPRLAHVDWLSDPSVTDYLLRPTP